METATSLPFSKKPATCPYIEPDVSNSHLLTLFFHFSFSSNLPFQVFQAISFLLLFRPELCIQFYSPPHMLQGHRSSSVRFDRPNSISRGGQIMKFLITNSLRLHIAFPFLRPNVLFITLFPNAHFLFFP